MFSWSSTGYLADDVSLVQDGYPVVGNQMIGQAMRVAVRDMEDSLQQKRHTRLVQ